jgi:SPOR domain
VAITSGMVVIFWACPSPSVTVLTRTKPHRPGWKARRVKLMWRLTPFSFLLAMTRAHAANIEVVPLGTNKPSLVNISGTIDLDDRDVFLRKIGSLTNAIVAFDSDGGSLIAGLQIGETIRLKNFATLVPDGARCASSCALAWLGGTRRFMGRRAQIGFHAAYNGETGKVTSTGNALVGAYLNKIGLPYDAVVYITSASPEALTWLSKSDAEKLGIEVSLFSAPAKSTTSQNPRMPSGPIGPPRKDIRTTGNYAVQVLSRRTEAEARAAYKVLQEKFPSLLGTFSPMIYRTDLGDHGVFFRAAVGPFETPDEASQFCGSLKSAGGQCIVQKNPNEASKPVEQLEQTNTTPSPGAPIFPTSISPNYSGESDGKARMHTCVDQYNANKATNANGGMKWIEMGGGYYSECNKRLKG